MAMARSSFNGMWNYTCEGGTYLCAQAKDVATFMLQTWRRGLICLLLLGSLPFLAPMILVSVMVGGVLLVPLLCVASAYYALFRPSSLLSIIKWFRSPKSVLRPASRPTELTVEYFAVHDDEYGNCEASPGTSNLDLQSADREMLDVDSEYVIVANEADQSEDGEPVELASPVADVPASAEAVVVEEAASIKAVALVENFDATEVDVPGTPVAEEEAKVAVLGEEAALTVEDVAEQVEELEASVLEEKEVEAFVEEAATPESDVSIAEPKEPKEVEGKPEEALVVLEKEILPLVVSEPVSEEENASVAVEEAEAEVEAAPSLESEVHQPPQEEDDEVENGKELNESKLPALGHVLTGVVADHQDSFEVELEEPKRLEEKLADAQSASEDPVASREPEYSVESKAFEGTQVEGQPAGQLTAPPKEQVYLEESEGHNDVVEEPGQVQFDTEHSSLSGKEQKLEDSLPQTQLVSEDLTASRELEHLGASEGTEEKEGEGYPAGQLTALGKEEESFDEIYAANEEPGQSLSASTQPLLSKGKPGHSEHGLPLKQVVQQIDETVEIDEIEGESDMYRSASETFTLSENEQEQVDVLEPNESKFKRPTIHYIESHAGSSLEEFAAEDDVPVDQIKKAPVVQEKKDESALMLEDEAEAAPAIELETPVMEEKSVQLEKSALLEKSTSVEVSALVEEAVAEKADESELQAVDKEEVPASEVVKEAPIAESEVTKQADAESRAPEVHFEETPVMQEEAELPSGVSQPVSEEKEAPVILEENDAMAAPLLESGLPLIDQQSLPVDSEPVELASPVADVPAIAEAVVVEEAASAETTAPEERLDVEGVEELKAPVVQDKEAEAFVEQAGAPQFDAIIAEHELTKGPESGSAAAEVLADEEAPVVQKKDVEPLLMTSTPVLEEKEAPIVVEAGEATPTSEPDASVVEKKSLIVEESFPMEVDVPASSVAAIEEAPPMEDAAPLEEAVAEKVEELEVPVLEENETEASFLASEEMKIDEALVAELPAEDGAAPEALAPFAEPAASEGFAEEVAPLVHEKKVELPLTLSEPLSEVPGVEKAPAVLGSEPVVPLIAEKSLPVEEAAPVDVAALEEEPVVMIFQEPEPPVVEKEEAEAAAANLLVELVPIDEALRALLKVDFVPGAPEFETSMNELDVTKDIEAELPAPKFVAEEEVELCVTGPEYVLEEKGAAVAPFAPGVAPEAPVNAEKALSLEEVKEEIAPVDNFEKDEAAEGPLLERNDQDLFPTLRPLNVALSKQSYEEQSKESNSSLNSAPARRQLRFKIGEGEEEKLGTPTSPNHKIGAEVANFTFKSRSERDHLSHRHSAPDFLGTYTWSGELPLSVPQDKFRSPQRTKFKPWSEAEGAGRMENFVTPARSYSASATDRTEPHMGEFESLLQSWQERDQATHFPATSSPSGSPFATSPAKTGHQIREEINTIQRIIGQVLPPQHSLWKEVEILSQIVGMELPYMGDVSDLSKARHGLDLLKVVVGIK